MYLHMTGVGENGRPSDFNSSRCQLKEPISYLAIRGSLLPLRLGLTISRADQLNHAPGRTAVGMDHARLCRYRTRDCMACPSLVVVGWKSVVDRLM